MQLIVSQVGYDVHKQKYAYLRGKTNAVCFAIVNCVTKEKEYCGLISYWGEKWNDYWYILDFTDFNKPGMYEIQILPEDSNTPILLKNIRIGEKLLWHSTWYDVSLGQLEVRASNAYTDEGGWRDCGSQLQEISSHIIMLDALIDLAETNELSKNDRDTLNKQITTGANYIIRCQETSGGFVHERKSNQAISTGNCLNAAQVLARVSRYLSNVYPELAGAYLNAAESGYNYIKKTGPIVHAFEDECYTLTHGAPKGMLTPPNEFMTRDLFSKIDAAIELYLTSQKEVYLKDACSTADDVLKRQISKDNAEYGFYGHFRTYESYSFSEKANQHCGAWDLPYKSYNQGAHKPHWIIPLIKLADLCHDDKRKNEYLACVANFVYGYFVPACKQSPFGILPSGIYADEGLLYFGVWYHGHAKIYGYAAKLANTFAKVFNDNSLVDIATQNLQWVAGLNVAGKCLIVGVGDDYYKDWNALKGTIINGFDATKQFSISPVTRENDLPAYIDDEGGIHHCSGFLAGICSEL